MKSAWTLLAVCSLVVVACSGSEEDKYSGVGAFCDAKAKEECRVAAKCAATEQACLTARRDACTKAAEAATVGTRAYRSNKAEACVDKTRETYAKGTITPSDLAALNDVCARVFQGTVSQPGGCETSYDCADGLICDKKRCASRVEKRSGELCGNPGEVCERGAFCAPDQGVMNCVTKKARGEQCDPQTAPCLEDLRCDGTCQDRFQSGAACTSDADCASGAPFCDPYIGNKCDAGLIFAPGAAACRDYGAN